MFALLAAHPRECILVAGCNGVRNRLPADDCDEAVEQIVALLKLILADREGAWRTDYVRLRF